MPPIFELLVLAVLSWMARSVWRMRRLPAWRRRLPVFLLAGAGVLGILAGHLGSGTEVQWLCVVLCPVLALASWAASLRERRRAGVAGRLSRDPALPGHEA